MGDTLGQRVGLRAQVKGGERQLAVALIEAGLPALGSRKEHRTATLGVCFHALQLTKRIERANRNQFEAHEVGLSKR